VGAAKMEMKGLCVVVFFVFICSVNAKTYHVTTNGTNNGDGSEEKPWDLNTAFSKVSPVSYGDNILLHHGTYYGSYYCYINYYKTNVEDGYVVVKPFENDIVVFDGSGNDGVASINDYGKYVIWENLIITNSSNDLRYIEETGSWPETFNNSAGITSGGDHCEYHNLIIHNVTDSGIESWWQNKGGVINGCIIYNVGWRAPDRGHGHGIYMQNFEEFGNKNVRKNIIFNANAYSYKVYGEHGAMNNVNIYDNIFFNAGAPAYDNGLNFLGGGSGGDPTDLTFVQNYIYQDSTIGAGGVRFGYEGSNYRFKVENNIVQTTSVNYWTILAARLCDESSFRNNVFSSKGAMLYFTPPSDEECSSIDNWDNNSYYYKHEHQIAWKYNFLAIGGEFDYTWDYWRSYKPEWDISSRYVEGEIDLDTVIVIPNDYEAGRAHIAIYNNSKKDFVDVDVSNIVSVGDSIFLYDVENIWEPVIEKQYDGGLLSVPLNLTEISDHAQFYKELNHTDKVFGAYLLLKRRLLGGMPAPMNTN
jgi:hypothetical protein